jgi:hypothetical protein
LKPIFQYEVVPSQMTVRVIEWLAENCDLLPDWPAKSADFSSTKMLWAIMKHIVASMEPKTIGGLRIALTTGEMAQQSTVNKLRASFLSRLHLSLGNGGPFNARDASPLEEIRLHVDGRELSISSKDMMIPRLFKKAGTKWTEMSPVLENRSGDAMKNRGWAIPPHRGRRNGVPSKTDWRGQRRFAGCSR